MQRLAALVIIMLVLIFTKFTEQMRKEEAFPI
jgi:hypothetical protein